LSLARIVAAGARRTPSTSCSASGSWWIPRWLDRVIPQAPLEQPVAA
jgi:hypothetical protein